MHPELENSTASFSGPSSKKLDTYLHRGGSKVSVPVASESEISAAAILIALAMNNSSSGTSENKKFVSSNLFLSLSKRLGSEVNEKTVKNVDKEAQQLEKSLFNTSPEIVTEQQPPLQAKDFTVVISKLEEFNVGFLKRIQNYDVRDDYVDAWLKNHPELDGYINHEGLTEYGRRVLEGVKEYDKKNSVSGQPRNSASQTVNERSSTKQQSTQDARPSVGSQLDPLRRVAKRPPHPRRIGNVLRQTIKMI